MKIGIVGTFIRDRILPWQGQPANSIGGIFFTTSYLANLADPNTEIYPVSFTGADLFDELCETLSVYPNVKLDGIQRLERDNTRVELNFVSLQEREETTTRPMPPLELENLKVLFDADAVIFNLITGVDVSLQAIEAFRKHSKAFVHLDLHTRCLAIDEKGRRFYKKPDDWPEWFKNADSVQVNEKEAATIAELPEPIRKMDLIRFGRRLAGMPALFQITLGERGALLFRQKQQKPQVVQIPPVHAEPVVDVVGCGDAYEAAFVLDYMKSGDAVRAAKKASVVAALNCTFVGSSKVAEIKQMINRDIDNE